MTALLPPHALNPLPHYFRAGYRWSGGLIVDNFAGGGGASTGIAQGIGRSPDIAVNHNAEALAMHAENHPETKHFNESVWDINVREATGDQPVLMGWFSPDCTHFSVAKGGKPVKKAIRGLAWVAKKWAGQADMAMFFLENVAEFTTWGPLIAKRDKATGRVLRLVPDGKDKKGNEKFREVVAAKGEHVPYREQALVPDKKRAGQHFKQFIKELQALGYVVEFKANLVAADYGAPTTRKRFFMIARKDGLDVVWPEQTHGDPKSRNPAVQLGLADGSLKPWKIAGAHLDWSIPCPSIFKRSKPLAEKTLARIAKGVQRFVIDAGDNAFLVKVPSLESRMAAAGMKFRGDSAGFSMDDPLPTITAGAGAARPAGAAHALGTMQVELEPVEADFILAIDHTSNQRSTSGCDEPLTTTTSKARHARVAALLKHFTGVVGQDMRRPLPTITATDHNSVLEAELVEVGHVQRDFGNSVGQTLNEPLGTIMPGGGGKSALVASSLVKLKGTCKDGQACDEPLGTIQAQGNHYGEVRAFLTKFYSTGAIGQELDEPLHTITSKSRFGLVTIHGVDYQIVDIGMRMLEPHELYACQGFPAGYKHKTIAGKALPKHAQVRMVGNSVPPDLARALVEANVPRMALEVAEVI